MNMKSTDKENYTTKKVIHVITSLENGGAESFLYNLVKQNRKNDVLIISLKDDWGYGKRFEKIGCRVMVLGMKPERLNISHFIQLIKIFRKEKPEIVFTWMHHTNLFAGLAAYLAFVPNITWEIRDAFMCPEKEKLVTRLVVRVSALFSYFIPQKIIYVAEKAAEVHESIYYDKRKTTVISNGYDTQRFKPNATARKTMRKTLGISDDVILVGMIARFDPMKDHQSFINAAKILLNRNVPAHFLLCGSGISEDNSELMDVIDKSGIAKHITFAKTRVDIEQIYTALDLFLLTSVTEAFPNVLCEAMACGVPCVSTDVGDAKIITGDSGAIVPVGDYQQMAFELEKLVNLPAEKWASLKESVRKRIIDKFSMKQVKEKYMKLGI